MIVNHQIVTTYLARGGQAVAEMGKISSGYMNMGRQARGMGREVSLAERQMRAFGTTLRYAFAGSVIFGITSMVGKLNELQQQMGLIAAIAGPAGVNFGTSGLSRLQDELAAKSVDARTNISDMNNSVINFLSTVQGADPNEISGIVANIGIAAKLSQTPTEELTKTVTTLNIAAGRNNNLKTINSLLREWFSLISRAPGGIAAAPQIAQQLGPLMSVAQMGQMSPEQMFGFTQGALRFGATPSVALRGTQYFLQSLFKSPSVKGAAMMKASGLTPELLDQVGGTEFARRYLAHVKKLGASPTKGGVRKFGAITDVMPDTEAVEGDPFAPNLDIPGLSPSAIKFLSTTLGRIHGIRTALVLLQNPKLIDRYIKGFTDLQQGVGKDADQLKTAADKYRAQTPLQSAAIALDTLRVAVSRDLAGPLGYIGGGISSGAQALTGDSDLRKKLLIGGAAVAGAYGLSRFRGKGLATKGLIGAAAVESLASTSAPDGSVANPFFVIALNGGFGGGMPFMGGPGGGGRGMPKTTGNASKLGRLGMWGKRLAAPIAALAGWEVAAGVVAAMGLDYGLDKAGLPNPTVKESGSWLKKFATGGGWTDFGVFDPRHFGHMGGKKTNPMIEHWKLEKYFTRTGMNWRNPSWPRLTGLMSLPEGHFLREKYKGIVDQAMDPNTNLDKLERTFKRQFNNPWNTPAIQEAMKKGQSPFGAAFGMGQSVSPSGELILTINIADPKGKITKKVVKVPERFYKNGNGPTSRGRRKPNRMEIPSVVITTDERGQGGR